MNKKAFFIYLKIVFVFFLASGLFYFYVENVESAEARVEYIEYSNGSKVPVIQDPCQLKGTAKEEAVKYVKGYTHIGNEVNNGKTTIEEIKAKKFDDLNHLSTIIELSFRGSNLRLTYLYKLITMQNYVKTTENRVP